MKKYSFLVLVLGTTLAVFGQNGKSGFSNGEDTFIQKKNLLVEKSFYVLRDTELSGTLKTTGLSYFNSPVSIGSLSSPTETLDVFGNLKTRGYIFAQHLNVENSTEIGQDLTIGRDLLVTRYGYFEKVGIGVPGPLTESLEVSGNIKAIGNLLSTGLQTGNGDISQNLIIGGLLSVTGDASFSANAVIDGLVGIGLSPTEKLEVQGNIKSSDGLVSRTLTTTNINATTAALANTLQVEGVSTFNDAVNITGETVVTGDLEVEGNAKISGTLTANSVASESFTTNNLEVSNTLTVGGATTLNDVLHVGGATQLGNTLEVTGTTSFANTIDVTGNATFGSDASVSGNASVNGNLGIGVAVASEKLEVAGNAKISQTLTAKTISSEAFSTENLEVTNTLNVGGVTTLSDRLIVSGNSVINGNTGLGVPNPVERLEVSGNVKISQTLTANAVNSEAFSSDNLEVTNTLSVGGATTLNDQLTVTGTSILNGNLGLGVTAPVEKLEVAGNVKVSQDATIGNNATISHQLLVNGMIGVGKNPEVALDVNGDIRLSGQLETAEITSGSMTLDNATISQHLGVIGQATLKDLIVTGVSQMQDGLSVTGTTWVNGQLGIGKEVPGESLDVVGNAAISGNVAATAVNTSDLNVSRNLELSNLASDETYESFLVVDATGKVHKRSLSSFQPIAGAETNVSIPEQTLSVGTDATPSGYRLAVNGNIISNELTIQQTSDWPDYVFESDYSLMELSKVETYIQSNKHLPEVPSAAEVKEDGVQLGEMNAILLKKIEELTLHQIELQKQLKEQQKLILRLLNE